MPTKTVLDDVDATDAVAAADFVQVLEQGQGIRVLDPGGAVAHPHRTRVLELDLDVGGFVRRVERRDGEREHVPRSASASGLRAGLPRSSCASGSRPCCTASRTRPRSGCPALRRSSEDRCGPGTGAGTRRPSTARRPRPVAPARHRRVRSGPGRYPCRWRRGRARRRPHGSRSQPDTARSAAAPGRCRAGSGSHRPRCPRSPGR